MFIFFFSFRRGSKSLSEQQGSKCTNQSCWKTTNHSRTSCLIRSRMTSRPHHLKKTSSMQSNTYIKYLIQLSTLSIQVQLSTLSTLYKASFCLSRIQTFICSIYTNNLQLFILISTDDTIMYQHYLFIYLLSYLFIAIRGIYNAK